MKLNCQYIKCKLVNTIYLNIFLKIKHVASRSHVQGLTQFLRLPIVTGGWLCGKEKVVTEKHWSGSQSLREQHQPFKSHFHWEA
jgi:hypothetical protein